MSDVSFVGFLDLASNEDEDMNMSMTEEGLDALYDIFEHFSNGGTIHNFNNVKSGVLNADEVTAVLAVTWLDVQRFIQEKRKND